MNRIILLDMDGVLVKPMGYRAALRATVNYFIDPRIVIDEEALSELERRQISSEWDMAPLLIATYWNDILSRQPMQELPSNTYSVAEAIRHRREVAPPTHASVPEFPLLGGTYPVRSAYEAGCFPFLPEDLRRDLLTSSRNVSQSPTTHIFQHYTLGSRLFEETYNLPAKFETESYLLLYDQSPITDKIRAKLIQPNHHIVAFTNRPSGPPRELGRSIPGYPPEAEFALELAGLQQIPMIAHGRLGYLAAQHGIDPARIEKPSPFHALAAVLAAYTGEEWTGLQAANHWYETNSLNGRFVKLPQVFDLIAVEDTLGGIQSVRAAGEILKGAGFQVHVRPIGLTLGNEAKASAFRQAKVPFYSDWESIIEAIG